MHWGFPWTTKGKRPGTTRKMNTTNIRNLTSLLFRGIINKADNRCLVPFTRFAEPKPNAGRNKIWFTLNDKELSAFAGIWRPDKDSGNCYAFLTCEPNPLVKPIHSKAMPVILQPDDYDRWSLLFLVSAGEGTPMITLDRWMLDQSHECPNGPTTSCPLSS